MPQRDVEGGARHHLDVGRSVSCVECHTDTTLDSSATVAASWPTRKCVECHDYGASTTHDSYATTHTVEPGTCAGTGAGCHDFTDLSALHAVSQSGGAPNYQGCANADPSDPSACHSVLDARPAAIDPAASCGEGTSGCHQDMNTSNHGSATAHGFSAASDYDNGTVTGCTNSGAGCHGTETTYSNFVDYHPASGCTTGPCHTSADKAAFTATYDGDATCADCHDANYAGAPDASGADDRLAAGPLRRDHAHRLGARHLGDGGRHRERHVFRLPQPARSLRHGPALRPAPGTACALRRHDLLRLPQRQRERERGGHDELAGRVTARAATPSESCPRWCNTPPPRLRSPARPTDSCLEPAATPRATCTSCTRTPRAAAR